MTTIAVFAMGEMGSGVAGRLVEKGARVLTSLEGRSVASVSRAKAAGVEILGDADMIEQAELVLSIVPPSVARTTAERFLPLMKRSGGQQMFLDCNAIAPQTLLPLSKPFVDQGLRFGDASIIGPSPKSGRPSPRFYMSGPLAREAELLRSFGLDTQLLSDRLGDAKALKMAYAGITKGFQAIGAAMALGAARNGATDSLISELRESQPGLYAWLSNQLPAMYSKAYRWDGEMREIAKFLEPERGAVDMLTGAADLYIHIAADYREGPQTEIISTLDRFASPLT
jgi:3-hydroxyisobutyrate dehydrogenase-like beta-hydroxyacid dehydrogenase